MASVKNLPSSRQVALLGVASGLGQKKPGVEFAPRFIRDAGFFNFRELNDLGDIAPLADDTAHPTECLKEAWQIIARVRTRALHAIETTKYLITLGGDHSIAAGTISATLSQKPNARVVWIDAHGDMNTPQNSPTGNLHGMPLAMLMEFFKSPLKGPFLKPQNLLLLGARDLDPGEVDFITEFGITCLTSKEIRDDLFGSLARIAAWLKSSEEPVHLSFDVDSLDPADAPATGIRVPGGLSTTEAKLIVRAIHQNADILALDVVELNPLATELREAELTLANLKSILMEIPFAASVLSGVCEDEEDDDFSSANV